jgi:hypothetical protein
MLSQVAEGWGISGIGTWIGDGGFAKPQALGGALLRAPLRVAANGGWQWFIEADKFPIGKACVFSGRGHKGTGFHGCRSIVLALARVARGTGAFHWRRLMELLIDGDAFHPSRGGGTNSTSCFRHGGWPKIVG